MARDPQQAIAAQHNATYGVGSSSEVLRPNKLQQWVREHRPSYRRTERSWFAMVSLVSFGVAVFMAPVLFIVVGIAAAGAAWWQRESARQAVLNTAFVALFAGIALLLVSILMYVFQNL